MEFPPSGLCEPRKFTSPTPPLVIPNEEQWQAVEACSGGFIHLIQSHDPRDDLSIQQMCSDPWCSSCEPRREFNLVARLQAHVRFHGGDNWWFVTMSTRNTPELVTSFNLDNAAWAAFTKGAHKAKQRGSKHVWSDVLTYVGWREVTLSIATGFNLHRHLLVSTDTSYWDWKDLHRWWDRAAHGYAIVNVQSVASLHDAIHYCSKYSKKSKYWGGLSQLEAYRYADGLRKRNRIFRPRNSKPPVALKGYLFCCRSESDGDCEARGAS